jgi:pimeloyl-ACP methyl ester carboxylesterase
MMVGKEHNALLVTLEHRYYGDSQPFDDWSTENLAWLSSEQALADTANFIDGMNEQLGRKADWIIAGGSYPGAFVAWFKSKYPDHVVGAWSSSGVIHPIMDFTDMDYDTYDRTMDSSPDCTSTIQRANSIVTEMLKTDEVTQELADIFGYTAEEVSQPEFWYLYADIFLGEIQYGSRVSMCENLLAVKDASDHDLIDITADLAAQ